MELSLRQLNLVIQEFQVDIMFRTITHKDKDKNTHTYFLEYESAQMIFYIEYYTLISWRNPEYTFIFS